MTHWIAIVGWLALFGAGSSNSAAPNEVYRLAFELTSQTACSQSSASSRTKGTALLTVGSGRARLEVRLERYESFGPSFSRFRRGHRQFTRRRWRETHRFSGRLVRDFTNWRLSLDYCKSTNDSPCVPKQRGITLPCARRRIAVYPQKAGFGAHYLDKNETTRVIEVLRCDLGTNAPKLLEQLAVKKHLSLRLREDLVLHRHLGFLFMSGRNREFYRAPQ